MGDFEVFLGFFSTLVFGVLIYNVITIFTFNDLLRRFGFLKMSRRDFYECGFKSQTQKPVQISIQFLLITIFFLLYDIELVFLFPYVSTYTFGGVYDLFFLFFFFLIMYISLLVDYNKNALYWQD